MQDALAERLLAEVMNWSPEEVARERPLLQAMAAYKYDHYGQFSPGIRFIESLALWLHQLEPQERPIAYDFVRHRLIFVSEREMLHLVEVAYPDFIRPELIEAAARETDLDWWRVRAVTATREFTALLRSSLFLGLSDGAHTAHFRRSNPGLSNEQVWGTYDLSAERANDMLQELRRDLGTDGQFRFVFLLDDFSGSGKSYIRDLGDGGKLCRIWDRAHDEKHNMCRAISPDSTWYLVLYLSTEKAQTYLRQAIKDRLGGQVQLIAVHTVPDGIAEAVKTDKDLVAVCEAHFDSGLVDSHYRKGDVTHPHLGFDGCALPLVLYHNAPNNSLPLLWHESDEFNALFPRVSRHRSER